MSFLLINISGGTRTSYILEKLLLKRQISSEELSIELIQFENFNISGVYRLVKKQIFQKPFDDIQ
jgi:hypothetical protein